MRLCIERIPPPCRQRMVPTIESATDIAPAVKAVTAALAAGIITPGEAGTIAAVVDTFVGANETSDFDRRLKIMEADLRACAPEARSKPWAPGDAGYSTYARGFAADPR
jgi:hypothetical protein